MSPEKSTSAEVKSAPMSVSSFTAALRASLASDTLMSPLPSTSPATEILFFSYCSQSHVSKYVYTLTLRLRYRLHTYTR